MKREKETEREGEMEKREVGENKKMWREAEVVAMAAVIFVCIS